LSNTDYWAYIALPQKIAFSRKRWNWWRPKITYMMKIHHHNTWIRKACDFYFWVCSKHEILTRDVRRIQSRGK